MQANRTITITASPDVRHPRAYVTPAGSWPAGDILSEGGREPIRAPGLPLEATGPSWRGKRDGSAGGRLRGLAHTIFSVFLFHRSRWPQKRAPGCTSGKYSKAAFAGARTTIVKSVFRTKAESRFPTK